jgi:transketolase
MVDIRIIPVEEFHRVRSAQMDRYEKASIIADMCRANALSAVKLAGSGHIGSSFSAMDIVVWLYYEEMNTISVGISNPQRDIYFSSKGHDAPGLYSVLYSLGVIPKDKFLRLRRLGGLDGHPDVGVPGIESNSGSLGMGLSKGRGMAWAKRFRGLQGRVFVMTGDGELQEGENYEGMQAAVQQHITNLIMIVDHNKVQSDKAVSQIVDLGDIESKLRAFGWHVARCDGHDPKEIERVLTEFSKVNDRPKALIADTLKGRGVSFMEHPQALRDGKGYYKWHAGAPDDESFSTGHKEIIARINSRLKSLRLEPLSLELVERPVSKGKSAVSNEYVAEAFGKALVAAARRRNDLVVLDCDLASDCHIREFELTYPDRFIENGIAEQDAVSMAGGLARQGLLPVVNSFANFLAARANEQTYNNATEGTKIIYACHYAGLIPAGPGKSHQSLRDISLYGALPNFIILEPCNAEETRQALDYCIDVARENCVLRLVIGPSPRIITLPPGQALTFGRGVALTKGADAIIFSYGPVMLHEALLASESLAQRGFGLRVVNMPWLNRVDSAWLSETVNPFKRIYVLEDHAPVGGLGDFLLNSLMKANQLDDRSLKKFAVEGYPACGTPQEVLGFHGLDGEAIASRILSQAPDYR